MFRYLRTKKGQVTTELVVLFLLVVVALLSIQPYIKRGLQGRWKQNADDIGDQFSVGNTNYVKRVVTISNTTDSFGVGGQGVSNTALRADEQTNTEVRTVILNTDQEYMGQ